MGKNIFLLIIAFLFITFSCKNVTSNPQLTLNEIMIADNAGDIEKVLSLYTDDAILMPAARSNIVGKDAIRKNYENIFASSKLKLTTTTNEIITEGNIAVISGNTLGSVTNLTGTSTINVNDKFTMILKKVNDKWKIHRLMWSKDQ